MASIEHNLLEKVEAYATQILETQLPNGIVYHTIGHTRQVVFAVREIGINSGLSIKDIDQVVLAAWFHDLGYINTYDGHEEESKKIAKAFLKNLEKEDDYIDEVLNLIEATKVDVEPKNLKESVIKDADLYNLATPQAYKNSQNLRREWERFRQEIMTDKEWEDQNLDFFQQHTYFTPYGKEVLAGRKKKNIKKIRRKIKEQKLKALNAEQQLQVQLLSSEKEIQKLKAKLKKAQTQIPDRGIETMFRVTYRVHISLSAIADNKANILLSINAIIISVIASSIFGQIEDFPTMIIPALLILAVCMSTIVFAILSTRPKVNSGIFTREDILQKRTNLLFFGNFHAMPLNDYIWGIGEMMKDSSYLYGSMTKDIYFLGKVLAKKFQLLRIAYNIFMYGLILAVFSFGLAFWLGAQQ